MSRTETFIIIMLTAFVSCLATMVFMANHYRQEAIKRGFAGYNRTTAAFEWKGEGNNMNIENIIKESRLYKSYINHAIDIDNIAKELADDIQQHIEKVLVCKSCLGKKTVKKWVYPKKPGADTGWFIDVPCPECQQRNGKAEGK